LAYQVVYYIQRRRQSTGTRGAMDSFRGRGTWRARAAYQVVYYRLFKTILLTHSSRALQTERRTDRRTGTKAISTAERLLCKAS